MCDKQYDNTNSLPPLCIWGFSLSSNSLLSFVLLSGHQPTGPYPSSPIHLSNGPSQKLILAPEAYSALPPQHLASPLWRSSTLPLLWAFSLEVGTGPPHLLVSFLHCSELLPLWKPLSSSPAGSDTTLHPTHPPGTAKWTNWVLGHPLTPHKPAKDLYTPSQDHLNT